MGRLGRYDPGVWRAFVRLIRPEPPALVVEALTPYQAARADAQRKANETGFDYGLEFFQLYKKPSEHDRYHVFMLPRRDSRYGHERRCEVVMCENLERCQPGHGPTAPARADEEAHARWLLKVDRAATILGWTPTATS